VSRPAGIGPPRPARRPQIHRRRRNAAAAAVFASEPSIAGARSMKDVEDRLAAIGFRRLRREPECWRVTRTGTSALPALSRGRREPANSRALPLWLARLADRGRPAPYRISPAAQTARNERRRARG
jgi:hypothetical protein